MMTQASPHAPGRRPSPVGRIAFAELAAQFEPRLDALRCAIDGVARGQEKRRLERQVLDINRADRDARRAAKAILHSPIAWSSNTGPRTGHKCWPEPVNRGRSAP